MVRKILIPTDGSAHADVAALAGVRLAKEVGATVIGFAAVTPVRREVTRAALGGLDDDRVQRASLERATHRTLRALAKAAKAAGVPYTALCVISDHAAREIVEAARRNECDLIFMGSHGRQGLSRMLHGSVAAAVLASSDVPVTIYRASAEEIVSHANDAEGLGLHAQRA